MKKLWTIALILALFAGTAYAIVAVDDDGDYIGEAVTLDFDRGLVASKSGSTVTVAATGYKEGETTNVSTESSLTSAALAYGLISLQVGSAKTIGLSDGDVGQMITVRCSVRDGASAVIWKYATATPITCTGWSTLTFDTQGDSITLLWLDDTTGWVIVGNNGVTVA